uniref:Dynein regulatory complex protein 10 n=1 Tax=Catharus ustulatus TaxID=91951 RepID=A0A8C3UZJ4_CATUS
PLSSVPARSPLPPPPSLTGTGPKGMATPRKAGMPLDVVKALDPRQLKPDNMETERILTVLDETTVKLEITGLILRIIGSLERYARMLGPEMTSSLLEHQKLSMEVQHLLSSPGNEKSRRAVEQRLKCSMRNILRLFMANPLLYHGLKYRIRLRESPADVFIKAFMEFRDFTLERLLTSPDKEKEKIQLMEDISLQVEKNTEMISALQEELAAAIQTRDEEVNRKDKTIENLKTSIENLAKSGKADIQQIIKEGEKQQKEDEKASQERCARLKQDIQRLRVHLNALVLKHRASELVLRKVKRRRALGGKCDFTESSQKSFPIPLPWPGTPSTIPDSSKAQCPTWPWTLPGIQGQPQLLWAPCARACPPPREQFLPNNPSIPALWQWEAIPCVLSLHPLSPVPLQLSWSPFRPCQGL